MIPEVRFDFSFDIILLLIFISYLIYGYFSGGHKQIRLSINLILPFIIIYYLGRQITSYLYAPLSNTFLFKFVFNNIDSFKYTITMIIAYIITYLFIFIGIFIFSIYARRHILNENMRAKLGKKNNYLGAIVAFLNGYVLIYFIILPVFAMNLVDTNDRVTIFVLEHPPPFSRIARTAEKAVPIKDLADKAEAFQELLSVDGVEGYYNDAIYSYQQQYIGSGDSFETEFILEIYPQLTHDSRLLINDAYNDYFSETLTGSNYTGISRVLVNDYGNGNLIYQELIDLEAEYDSVLVGHKQIVQEYESDVAEYENKLEYYTHQLIINRYKDDIELYITSLNNHLEAKIAAIINETELPPEFTTERPVFEVVEPSGFVLDSITVEPIEPDYTSVIQESEQYIIDFGDKKDVSGEIQALGTNLENHLGLLIWYVDVMDREMASSGSGGNISTAINSFKNNYEIIIENINDDELEQKLYLAQMSVRSYDMFNEWLECTIEKIDIVPLDDLPQEQHRCDELDYLSDKSYDFTSNALDIVATLFNGESVSWIIVQYKYDYEAGIFNEPFSDFEEVSAVLESTKGLVDDYDLYYKDIASSIEGNVSMIVKIGISVLKYNMDIYGTLEETPLLSAFVNDLARMCSGSNTVDSQYNRDVEYCEKSEGDGGMFKELFNMQYLTAEVLFKAYIMIDDNNDPIIYDVEKMEELLFKANESVENNVFASEVISTWGDQFAFNVLENSNGYTLLEQMFDDGQITIDAMRILSNDEFELFSDEFKQRVRSMIR